MKPTLRKCANRMIIIGEIRYYIFWRKKFELIIFFTPIKNKIIDYEIDGINIKKLDIDLSFGAKLSSLIEWSKKNGFRYFKIEKFTR